MREHLHVNHRLGHSLSYHRCSRGLSSRVPIDQLRRCRGLGRMKTARISVTIERELAFLPMLGYKQSALERGSRRYLRLYINHNKQENPQARMIHCSPFPPPPPRWTKCKNTTLMQRRAFACVYNRSSYRVKSIPPYLRYPCHPKQQKHKKDCIKHDFVYPCPTP